MSQRLLQAWRGALAGYKAALPVSCQVRGGWWLSGSRWRPSLQGSAWSRSLSSEVHHSEESRGIEQARVLARMRGRHGIKWSPQSTARVPVARQGITYTTEELRQVSRALNRGEEPFLYKPFKRTRTVEAYSFGDSYRFTEAVGVLSSKYSGVTVHYGEVVHVPLASEVQKIEEAFIFYDGTVVLWGADHQSRDELLGVVSRFREQDEGGRGSTESPILEVLLLEMRGAKSGYEKMSDTIVLRDGGGVAEMVAMSSALQKSLTVESLETAMGKLESKLKDMPLAIMEGVACKPNKVMQYLGDIFALRDLLNLRGNFETPDAYWDQPELEELYHRISHAFEIKRRISVLNQKLDYAHELVQVRHGQLTEKHKTRLTNWIIYLICFTVVIESTKIYMRLSSMQTAAEAPAQVHVQEDASADTAGSSTASH